jgi:regulator of protease activity HflC (stomatin/prohibitin superfamily)
VTIVRANEVGVPVTFGRIGEPLQSGPHITAPWTDVQTLPTRPRTFQATAKVRTGESGSVTIRMSGRWATNRAAAATLYQQARTGDEDRIQNEIIGPNLVGAAGAFYGGLTNFDAVSGAKWAANAAGSQAIASRYLDRYGITVDSVLVREVIPDKATEDAIGRYAAQQRATNVAIEAQKTAAAEAKRRQIEAEGLAAAAGVTKNLTPSELATLCLQATERIAEANAVKGIPTYVSACGGGSTSVLAR